jgi:hypothetical protein
LYQKTKLSIHKNIKQKTYSSYQGVKKLHTNTGRHSAELPIKSSKNHPLSKENKQKIENLQKKEFI